MPSDPSKPLLRLHVPREPEARRLGRRAHQARPEPFSPQRQNDRFGPVFRRLSDVLARDPNALELRADPAALAPECLLVFEIRAAINTLSAAVAKIQGLELIDEEELESDEADSNPIAYLMVPDSRALQYILSLWNRWNSARNCLRDLRRGAMFLRAYAICAAGDRMIVFNPATATFSAKKSPVSPMTA